MKVKGIHRTTKKLKDGSERVYFYAWRGGPRLEGEPGSDEFMQSYLDAKKKARLRFTDPDTFGALLKEYQGAPEFAKLRASTRRDYLRTLDRIAEKFEDMPIVALDDLAVRAEFKAFRDTFADRPREADRVWAVLKRVLNVAKDKGRIRWNPCEGGGKLYDGSRAEFIWNAPDIALFEARAPHHLFGPFLAALETGQRQGDILALRWNQYDGTHIRLVQSKGRKPVSVRASSRLKAHLDSLSRVSTHVFVTSRGTPWTSDGYQASFRKLTTKLGLSHLNFHDLRGTFITMRRREGASIEEIAAVTRHSIKDVREVLEKHYLAFDQSFADGVILRMERNR